MARAPCGEGATLPHVPGESNLARVLTEPPRDLIQNGSCRSVRHRDPDRVAVELDREGSERLLGRILLGFACDQVEAAAVERALNEMPLEAAIFSAQLICLSPDLKHA